MSTTNYKLSDVATLVRGVSFDKEEASDAASDDMVPILRAGNIAERLILDQDLVWVPKNRVSDIQYLKSHDIAICMSSGSPAIVGKTATCKDDWSGSVGAFCAIIRPNTNRIMPEFLAFFLQSQVFREWTRQSSGANIKNIRKSELEAFAISVPAREEQQRIVDILSRAEGIVRLRREAQQKVAEIIPALFLDTFGDPATNPKGWPMSTIGDNLDAADYGSSTKASETGAGLPIIRMGNVTTSGALDLSDLKYVELDDAEGKKYALHDGDILFNRTNSKELVGKTGLWQGEIEAVIASYFIRLRVCRERIDPLYLWAFMNSNYMKRVLFDTARGAIGQANINSKELKAFHLALPPLGLQQLFADRCCQVMALQVQQTDALKIAQATFDALLAQSFAPPTAQQAAA